MLEVLLDAVDISGEVIGDVTVLFRERAAATASFTYRPTTPVTLPTDLIRKPVVIRWNTGAIENLFTGEVNDATWNLDQRTYTVQCSDFFQEQFEGKTDAQIEALIPQGLYSENVFGPRRDGWQYAQALMSTAPYDYFLDRDGNFQSSPWLRGVAAVPDFDLGSGQVLNDGAYSLEMAKGRDVQTKYNAKYQYRISRWKRRKHSFIWAGLTPTGAWCEWFLNQGYPLPTRDTISGAANGTGWTIGDDSAGASTPSQGGIAFGTHPASGTYCTPPTGWVISEEARAQVAISASWQGFRKWAQTITEDYQLTFNVPTATTTYKTNTGERSASGDIQTDDASWERGNTVSLDPGQTWQTDTLNDDYADVEDETVRTEDLQVILNLASTALHTGFRKNYVSITNELMPTLGLNHTVRVNTSEIEAKGKVVEYEHVLAPGNWTTRIKIGICWGSSGASDPLTTPARPDSSPSHAAPSNTTNIPTRVGGCPESLDYDPTWANGWMTNKQAANCTEQTQPPPEKIYPLTFVCTGPDIEAEARDEMKVVQPVAYNLAFDPDTLVLK